MILDRQPLNFFEVKEILENTSDSEKKAQMELYLKKFLKTKPERAEKIKQGLQKLDLLKIKRDINTYFYISKIFLTNIKRS